MIGKVLGYVVAVLSALLPFASLSADQNRTLATGQFGVWAAFAVEWRKHDPKSRECYIALNKRSSLDSVFIVISRVPLDHKGPVVPQIIISRGAPSDGPVLGEEQDSVALVLENGVEAPMLIVHQQVLGGMRYMDIAVAPDQIHAALEGIGRSSTLQARAGRRIFFDESAEGFAEAYARIPAQCGWPPVFGAAGD